MHTISDPPMNGKSSPTPVINSGFELIAQLSRFGIIYCTPEAKLLYTNGFWSDISGIDAAQALSRSWIETIDKEDQERVTKEWKDGVGSDRVFQSIVRYHHSEKGIIKALCQFIPDKNFKRQTIGYIGAVGVISGKEDDSRPMSITQEDLDRFLGEHTQNLKETNKQLKSEVRERKKVASALRESQERLHLLTDAAFEGIILTDDDIIIDVNTQSLAMFRNKRSDFIGKNVEEFITPVSEILLKNRVSLKSNKGKEYVAIRKDGSTFPVDLHAREIRRKNKSIKVTVIRDVTEYKYLETSARLAKENMEVLRQAMAEMSSDHDFDHVLDQILFFLGRIIPFHRAALLMIDGANLKMIAGKGFNNTEATLDSYLTNAYARMVQANQADKLVVLDHLVTEPDLEPFWKAEGVGGWISVPMESYSSISGYLTIAPRKSAELGAHEKDFLQIFAKEAAIAIENTRLFEKVQTLAITDPLTGLFNRRHFFERAEDEWHRSNRYGHPLSAIMVDIDRFKRVNDRYGHAVGDAVLIEMANACRKIMRFTDILCRYGGEEFVILLPETDQTGALDVANRVKENIAAISLKVKNRSIKITVSMGIASNEKECKSIDDLLDRADRALYQSKRQGRNRYTIWTSSA